MNHNQLGAIISIYVSAPYKINLSSSQLKLLFGHISKWLWSFPLSLTPHGIRLQLASLVSILWIGCNEGLLTLIGTFGRTFLWSSMVGEGKNTYFWEDQRVGVSMFCAFSTSHPSKIMWYRIFQFGQEVPSPFCFSFRSFLFDKEAIDVALLLSMLEAVVFSQGRKDFRVWNPNPWNGFSCNPFFLQAC